ncbi:MAG: zinc-ribbon domain-containing protein [Lachnospiraceae bacterium]|nr:zinc-ribbon domain-containing protein [Lachnospiraceae bacterium]
MKCPKCGAKLDDYARVCNSCGLEITVEVLRNGYKDTQDQEKKEENQPKGKAEKLEVPVGKVVLVIVLSVLLIGTLVWLVAQTTLEGGMLYKNKQSSTASTFYYTQNYN